MQLKPNTHTTARYGIGLAGILLAVLLGVGLVAMGVTAAPVGDSPYNVSLDDPQNEEIGVTLDFAAATDATVELTDGDVIYETTTISGNTSASPITTTLGTGSASADDALQLTVDSPSAGDVSITETTIIKTTTVNVTDAANETLVVDAAFAGGQDANATVSVTDSAGTDLMSDTIAYTDSQHEDGATLTREYNASDGIVADDLSVEIAVPVSAYDAAYATVESGGGSGGGLIGGQDSEVVIVAVVVIGGVGYYGRENGWF